MFHLPSFFGRAIALTICSFSAVAFGQTDASWLGGTGNWSDSSNWSGGVVPDNNGPTSDTFNVFLDQGNSIGSIVTLDQDTDIDTLTIDSGDTFRIQTGREMYITNSSLTNNGLITINGNASGGVAELYFVTLGTISGTGSIDLTDAQFSILSAGGDNDLMQNGINHTITGSGIIGEATGTIENFGFINANTMRVEATNFFNSGNIDVATELTFEGGFIQSEGTLELGGGTVSQTTASQMLFFGGSVEGTGMVLADVELNAALSPSSSFGSSGFADGTVGMIEFTNLDLLGNSLSEFEIGGLTAGSDHDFVNVQADLALDGILELSLINGFASTIEATDIFVIFEADMLSGEFSNVADGQRLSLLDGTGSFIVNYDTGVPGEHLVFLSDFSSIPEPTAAGFLFALGACVAARRRR